MQRIYIGRLAAVLAIVSLSIVTNAQGPAVSSARHVRLAPIQVGRLVSAPVTNAVGSFSVLRSSSRGVSVHGVVQNQFGAPVPNAGTIRVRNLHTNTIAGTGVVDAFARFNMSALPPAVYAAELVSDSGTVIASSPAFSASAGEVVQIAQTVNIVPQGFARIASRATAAALSSAASSGITAIAPGASVTPGR